MAASSGSNDPPPTGFARNHPIHLAFEQEPRQAGPGYKAIGASRDAPNPSDRRERPNPTNVMPIRPGHQKSVFWERPATAMLRVGECCSPGRPKWGRRRGVFVLPRPFRRSREAPAPDRDLLIFGNPVFSHRNSNASLYSLRIYGKKWRISGFSPRKRRTDPFSRRKPLRRSRLCRGAFRRPRSPASNGPGTLGPPSSALPPENEERTRFLVGSL